MKKNFLKIAGFVGLMAVGMASCTKDLDRMPTNSITSEVTYKDVAGYKSVLAKVYGSYATPGNDGINQSDLAGLDPGQGDFLRLFWNAQELSTEEAHCVWNDPGIPDFHNLNWTSSNVLLAGLYNRSLYQITVANELIRESSDAKVAGRGISGKDAEDIKKYRVEARFLRAFQYWVLLDLFGNPPFVTENDPIGKYIPPQIKRADLFAYIEKELKEIEPEMIGARQNEYGRADKAAVDALLARLYLNAEVYLGAGKGRYADAVTYAKAAIDGGYTLHPTYKNLFLGDNNLNNPEVILSINYDGTKTQNNGGTTFLINAAINADMNPASFGVPNGGWGGNRATKNLPDLFTNVADKRAMFYGDDAEITNVADFKQGKKITKFRNVTTAGAVIPSPRGDGSSVDFPLFRLAEMYLIYAEGVKRGGTTGTEAQALVYLNNLRQRAYGNTSGNISSYDLQYVLDERGRELYWEGFRRTDLIRYDKFTSSTYLWPWKGGVKDGRGVEAYRKIYPIPSTDLTANPSLKQNDGY